MPPFNFGIKKQQSMQNKEAIMSIDIVLQMWIGFPIHEVVVSQRDKK